MSVLYISEASESRRAHLNRKIAEAYDIVTEALETHFVKPKKRIAAECVTFTGGDDSTVLAHLFRRDVDYAVHIDTSVFVLDPDERERRSAPLKFVRQMCAEWDLPLIVQSGELYRDLVLDQGFPGPAQHDKMYQRLKERGFRKVRRHFVGDRGRKERVLFLGGRRRDESDRREDIPENDRDGALVWAAPFANWTKDDTNLYRQVYNVPRSPVSQHIHMSGECLCGAYAKKGEIDEIGFFYPATAQMLHDLEVEVSATGKFKPERCQWGWGAYRKVKSKRKPKPQHGCDGCIRRLFEEDA